MGGLAIVVVYGLLGVSLRELRSLPGLFGRAGALDDGGDGAAAAS
jgi:hypothetical protein